MRERSSNVTAWLFLAFITNPTLLFSADAFTTINIRAPFLRTSAATAATRTTNVPLPSALSNTTATTTKQLIQWVQENINNNAEEEDKQSLTTTIRKEIFGPPMKSFYNNPWEVHKFGGASLATAELYKTVGDLLQEEAKGRGQGVIPTMAVVSAKGGMTDLLVQVVDSALTDLPKAQVALDDAFHSQVTILLELVPDRPDITDPIVQRLTQDKKDIWSCIQSLRMIHTVPDVTMEVVTGYGEIWSAQTLYAYLQSQDNIPTAWIDARDVLTVQSTAQSGGLGEKGSASTGGVTPLWDITTEKLSEWWQDHRADLIPSNTDSSSKVEPVAPIIIVTGFVAQTDEGVPTTLKRSGSDYSATIFGSLLNANRVTMWKNTDGVYTADPRRVPEAFPISSLNYDEAMELAFFGAQVLHPSAMEPCIEKNIPVYVRNIFNPAFQGTAIQGRSTTLCEANTQASNQDYVPKKDSNSPIKGITSVDKVSIVTLEGATLTGANVASRVLGAMSKNNIAVLIITQASSESSISIAVPENQGPAALAALEDAFELELSRSTITSLSLTDHMSIVAIVGEGMALTSGVAATFLQAMAQSNVNLRLIAQGSSERQVAVIVSADDVSRALRAVHMAFTLSETTASIAILGATGTYGRSLIKQLQRQQERLVKELGVDFSVKLASCRSKMVADDSSKGLGLDVKRIRERLVWECLRTEKEGDRFDLDKVTDIMTSDINPLRVIVDCTDSQEVGGYYEQWLEAGIHVISPGRTIASGDMDRFKRILAAQRGHAVEWLRESSVGSALPIISTIQDLRETGDEILTVEGCVSETMSFIFSTLNQDIPFSEAFSLAAGKGLTEKEYYEDISGLDMARKVVILAREIGLNTNLEDVEVESFLPEVCDIDMDEEAMINEIKCLDKPMLERFTEAEAKGCKLRYKFTINAETGQCKCGLAEIESEDPVFRLKSHENVVTLRTRRYNTSPLLIKGSAAGPDLKAAAIFTDLLRLSRAYSAK